MGTGNVQEAKTHLSRLVEEVQGGMEIIIGKAGKPLAKLVKYQLERPARRELGCLKGSSSGERVASKALTMRGCFAGMSGQIHQHTTELGLKGSVRIVSG